MIKGQESITQRSVIQRSTIQKRIIKDYQLYLFILPALIYIIVFKYIPMYGVQIAFKDYIPTFGIWGSEFVGLKHFERFFNSYVFKDLIKNTLLLSFIQLIAGFPFPIIIALCLNQMELPKYKKFIQTIIYAPHFISTVVLVGIMIAFLSPRTGIVNHIVEALGGERILFLGEPSWFRPLYVISGVWQNTGWGTIIYLAALSAISPAIHESAIVDGANKFQRIFYIDIPGILPTAVILLILNVGKVMSLGFEKAYLMQTALNLQTSEIISTYVYKIGLLDAQFSFSSAVGLFNSIINFILLITVNQISKKLNDVSLW